MRLGAGVGGTRISVGVVSWEVDVWLESAVAVACVGRVAGVETAVTLE